MVPIMAHSFLRNEINNYLIINKISTFRTYHKADITESATAFDLFQRPVSFHEVNATLIELESNSFRWIDHDFSNESFSRVFDRRLRFTNNFMFEFNNFQDQLIKLIWNKNCEP